MGNQPILKQEMETTEQPVWRHALARGLAIPALPLALKKNGAWSEPHQRAVLRYYIDSGAGGIAVGVHSTQFAIRDPKHALFEPVLNLSSEVIDHFAKPDFVRIAGICGDTKQALREADIAIQTKYQAGLLSLAALRVHSEHAILNHVQTISKQIPIIGFYLQPAVGGRVFSYDFWRRFCDIKNVIAIKIAPFNRYYTFNVVRAVIDSGRADISLYTGNDDNIIADLLTPFEWAGNERFIAGGLLGQWGVWTRRAVELLDEVKVCRESKMIPANWLTRNATLTDANAAIFDAVNGFAGCIPGILEILTRQNLMPSNRCLDPKEQLSPGQAKEIDRVCAAYPELTDDEFVETNRERWFQ